jgi:NADPH:quinone reductase-like Zn-dependent oxidoreductase
MKAIVQDRYGEADVLALEETGMPTVGADDVLVRVHAAGVDPGVWHLMTGLPYLFRLMLGLRKPKGRVRGLDLSGRVHAVGGNVTRFQPGDEVFGSCAGLVNGSFAEYACAREDRLAPKPKNLTFEQAAAVPVSACTALQGLRDLGQAKAAGGGRVASSSGCSGPASCRSSGIRSWRRWPRR